MRLPSAAAGSPHISRAMFSEINATGLSSKTSDQEMSRPVMNGVPVVRKYPGEMNLRVREWLDQDTVDDAENRRIGPNSYCQRQGGGAVNIGARTNRLRTGGSVSILPSPTNDD